jgi:hypothetical protein
MSETVVVVSVDTEEDNWSPARERVTVENIRALPRLQAHCDGLGVPLTYFTTYQVATTPWAARLLGELQASGRAEVAAHLHPWNTPPLDEAFVPRHTMLKNIPASLQRAKIASVRRAIEEHVGTRPAAFRTGRFGLGSETVRALIDEGFRVDSSITPWMSWVHMDDGPDFIGAPLAAYALDGSTDPRVPVRGGRLLEIPLSSGYSRWPFERWHGVYTALRQPWARPFHLAGLGVRLGVVCAVMLSPEVSPARDMLRLAALLIRHGVTHLSVFLHSPSLVPGLSPFAPGAAQVDRLHAVLADFVEGLGRLTTPVCATISDAARRLAPDAGAGPVADRDPRAAP